MASYFDEQSQTLVRIEGGAPFGFRLFGGDGQPLVIAKLRKKSKAWDAGLEEGDILLSVNDRPCRDISHADAMRLVDDAGQYLNLKILRKGGMAGQLFVSRGSVGGGRQRSLTPAGGGTVPSPVQFKTAPSPEPPRRPASSTQSTVQWSSRTTSTVHGQPTMVHPVQQHQQQQQQRTFQIHLSEPETGPNDDYDDDWGRPSKKPGFLPSGGTTAKEHSRSPSNGPLFTVAPPLPKQPRPSAAGAQSKSPAVWKPSTWQPEVTEPKRTSFSQEISVSRSNAPVQSNYREMDVPLPAAPAAPAAWKLPSWQQQVMEPRRTSFSKLEVSATRSSVPAQSNYSDNGPPAAAWKPPSWQTDSSRTTTTTMFSQDNQAVPPPRPSWNASKENVPPLHAPPGVNRNTPSALQTNNVEVAKHKPNVWQPSSTPPQPRKAFPVAPSAPSPRLDFDLGSDGGDGDGGGRGDGGERGDGGRGDGGGRGGGGWKQRARNDDVTDGFGKPPLHEIPPGFGKLPFHEIPPHLNKIITANVDDSNDDKFGSILHDTDKKQVYVDSSFYHDPAHKYPTVDEQIKMARQVALSLTAPSNEKARGHRMFMKRKEKSDKWIVDTAALELNKRGGMSDTEADLYYNPTPWSGGASTWKAPGGGKGAGRDVAVPPPLPTSKLFAPKLNPEDESGERSKALSAEEFERLRLFSQKTTHTMINPQICFTLAEDLRQSKGKGGRMFAKRRAKSEEWTIEGPPRHAAAPDPKLLQKISGGFAPAAAAEKPLATPATNGTRSGVGVDLESATTVNRLKEMIELPKAKMTPWDAVAEHGNVDLAFEHLSGISFVGTKKGGGASPFADSVANSLQQATQRKSDFRPTSAASRGPPPPQVQPQPQPPPHPSPAWNRPAEPTPNNRLSNKMASHSPAGFADFSPSSSHGSGYRPVAFKSSSGNTGITGGFSDL